MPSVADSQARRGNQNAVKHRAYSKLDPPSADELAALARQAAATSDLHLLKTVARAYADQALREEVQGLYAQHASPKRQVASKLRALARDAERQRAMQTANTVLVTHRVNQARR